MIDRQLKIVIVLVWLIGSAVGLLPIIMPWMFSERVVLAISGAMQAEHHDQPCSLCGMTRAFLAISRGDLHAAVSYNRGSVALFGTLLVNASLAVLFCVSCLHRLLWVSPASRGEPGVSSGLERNHGDADR